MSEIVPTERELWNTAKIYSISHVAEPLVRCRKLINICYFGVEEIGQEIGMSLAQINNNRINAINRLLIELILLNTPNQNFMKKGCIEGLKELKNRLLKVKEVIDGISYDSEDQRTGQKTVSINEKHYNTCLSELEDIYCKSVKYLSDLIFPSGTDLDLEKIKKDLIEGG